MTHPVACPRAPVVGLLQAGPARAREYAPRQWLVARAYWTPRGAAKIAHAGGGGLLAATTRHDPSPLPHFPLYPPPSRAHPLPDLNAFLVHSRLPLWKSLKECVSRHVPLALSVV